MIDPKDGTHDDYRRKIKTREVLHEIIGPRPRPKKVIMCHGAFDLVHPGHVRHLMYAKGKADLLVASLTSDAHISKGNYRPFVPQNLRAMNLAALELVDYVIIDEQATPLENIAYLQPDFFAKGYEYTGEGVHPKTPIGGRAGNAPETGAGDWATATAGITMSTSAANLRRMQPLRTL
jgi:cytidyltransferase-like protein